MIDTAARRSTLQADAPLTRPGPWFWPFTLLACLAVAALTLVELQLACTIVLVALVTALYTRSRAAGMAGVWLLWLLAPEIRRLFGLTGAYLNADPLAIAPFLATAICVAIELTRGSLSRRAKRILVLALIGYLIGIPEGIKAAPSMAYSLFSYGTACASFVLGYREVAWRLEGVTLYRVFSVAGPLIGIYAATQYLITPTSWDNLWLKSVSFTSIGAQTGQELRVFGTLNAPGTLGPVLALTVLCYLLARRADLIWLVGLAGVLVGLALTLERASWIALIAGLLTLMVASRGRAKGRLVVVLALTVVSVVAMAAHGGAARSVLTRFNTLGSLGSDTSAQQRLQTPTQLLPVAIASPLGIGLGQAGEATRLGASELLRAPDNAYLSLMYQLGPAGFLAVIVAIGMGVASAWRRIRRSAAAIDSFVFVAIGMLIVLAFSGDILYGITGVAFWYLLGLAVHRDETDQGVVKA